MSSTASQKKWMKSTSKISDPAQIPMAMAQVFQDAQKSISAHRKLVIILKSIQKRAIELEFEDGFNLRFGKLINRILVLKKGESVGDKIVKFCSLFVQTIQKDEEALKNQQIQNDEGDTENYARDLQTDGDEEDGPAARFVDYLLRHLLRGIQAKDKNVRFRIVQILAHIMNDIGEIDEELYKVMLYSLNKRLYDKEPNIRIQAISCMSRFQSIESENPDEISQATQRLLLAIQNDDSADVRRAALLNLEKTSITKPFLLERARDSNSINRRLVYSRIMKEIGDFRDVEYELRDKLLTWGLRDREGPVQAAAIKMFSHNWFNTVDNDLNSLLERLHVSESEIAETAMKMFFKARPEQLAKINITGEMWKALTSEISFLIRTLYDHCIEFNLLDIIDQFYPESAELSTILGKYLKLRLDVTASIKDYQDNNGGNIRPEDREKSVELDFILKQLFLVAKDYDFSDEIGRREMLRVLRSSLTNDFLPDQLIEAGLQVLRKISINERDFCSMCAEIVTDIRDSVLDEIDIDDTFHSAASDIDEDDEDDEDDDNEENGDSQHRKKRSKGNPKQPKQPPEEIIVQCLLITQHLFELTEEPLRDNLSLTSLVDSLVTPAVLNRESTVIRAMGIKCLGLCCLLDKELSIENLYLFGICAAKGDEELRITSVKIICDILAIHGIAVLDVEDGVDYLSLAKLFYRILRMSDMPSLQSITAEGLCKLFLADILTDEDLFETLVLSYFHPQNIDNQSLRQALTFCIPVYSFSHPSHQDRVAKIGGDCFYRLFNNENEYSGFEKQVAPPSTVLQQLIHWCDPANVVNRSEEEIQKSPAHLILAITLLEAVEQNTPKNIKKSIIINLAKLHITSSIELKVLKGLKIAIEDTRKCVFEDNSDSASFKLDATTIKAFNKFSDSIDKLIEYAEQAENELLDIGSNHGQSRTEKSLRELEGRKTPGAENFEVGNILENAGLESSVIHTARQEREASQVDDEDEHHLQKNEIFSAALPTENDNVDAVVLHHNSGFETSDNSDIDEENSTTHKDEFGRILSPDEIARNEKLRKIDDMLKMNESDGELDEPPKEEKESKKVKPRRLSSNRSPIAILERKPLTTFSKILDDEEHKVKSPVVVKVVKPKRKTTNKDDSSFTEEEFDSSMLPSDDDESEDDEDDEDDDEDEDEDEVVEAEGEVNEKDVEVNTEANQSLAHDMQTEVSILEDDEDEDMSSD